MKKIRCLANWIAIIVLSVFVAACSPPAADTEEPASEYHSVTIMTFNVENLFDNEDDAGKTDETFFALSDKQSRWSTGGPAP